MSVSTQKIRFGVVGMSSDHVWTMGDGLAALPEVELVTGAEPYPELRERATEQRSDPPSSSICTGSRTSRFRASPGCSTRTAGSTTR